MSDERDDLDVQVDQQWTRFRVDLADQLAGLDDDETIRIDVLTGTDADELVGAGPFVQFVAFCEGRLRAEVAGDGALDARYAPDHAAVTLLVEHGWEAPDEQGDEMHFHLDCELRDADRVASLSVLALRDVFGCPHPSFLSGDLPTPMVRALPPKPRHVEEDDAEEELAVFPQDHDHLQELVDAALGSMFSSLTHDSDGEIPIWCDGSVLYVRVSEDRPSIELYCHLVTGVEDHDRLGVELDILNRSHRAASFFTEGGAVIMRHTLPAMPFVAVQLRMFLSRMMDEVDQMARDLIARVGGQRPTDATDELFVDDVDDDDPVDDVPHGLLALVELLHAGPVPAAEVALLLDEDRHELVLLLVGLRTGRVTCAAINDLEVVLDHLRAALRFVVERLARADALAEHRVVRQRSHQLSLLPEVEPDQGTLDAGRWDQEVS